MGNFLTDRLPRMHNIYFQLGQYVVWFSTINQLFEERSELDGGHVHSHMIYDVHIPVQGSYFIVTDEDRVEAKPGFLVIVAPGVYHNTKIVAPQSEPIKRVNFKFAFLTKMSRDPLLCPANRDDEAIASAFAGIRHIAVIADDFECQGIMRQIHRLLMCQNLGYYQNIQGLLTCLVTACARQLHQCSDRAKPLMDVRRETIEMFFNSNSYLNTSQETLSQLLHISTRQLNRLLIEIYGMGYKEKLIRTRISIAKNLLCCTDKRVSEIAELCGYGAESSLNHAFKRLEGVSPREYREHTPY